MSLTLTQIVAAFDASPSLKEEVRQYLANERGLSTAPIVEPHFLATIIRGTHPSVTALIAATQGPDKKASDYARQIALKCPVAGAKKEVNLYWNTVEELGFPKGATWAKVHVQLTSCGSQLCEPEDGPQLWRQNLEEFRRGWLWMAMKPIAVADGDLRSFSVSHGGGVLWLFAGGGRPGCLLVSGDRVVFSR